MLGPHVAAVEGRLHRDPAVSHPLVKGIDLHTRDMALSSQLQGYDTYLETDYSRFDRSISRPWLEQVQDLIFEHAFPVAKWPLFHAALRLARTTRGKSDFGVRYKTDGTRCSGDAHTSIGNGIINAFNTYACLRDLPADSWTSVHEGDDGVIAVRHGHGDVAEANMELLGVFGFEIKMDRYNTINDVSFCGRHFYEDEGAIKSHCDIMRSLHKFHTSVSNHRADAMLLAKAMSYYSTDRDTPLVGPLTYSLIRVLRDRISFSAKKRALHGMKIERYMGPDVSVNMAVTVPDITTDARVSCMRRTGLTVEQQEQLESAYGDMIKYDAVLVVPRIPAAWYWRQDGFIHGDPATWVRAA